MSCALSCFGEELMRELFIDIETFSPVNLSRSGVYPYAESPEFRILLIAYSVSGGPVRLIDLASGDPLSPAFLSMLQDPSVLKWAFNASFERVCLSRLLRDRGLLPSGTFLSPASWRCTMVWAATLGLPLSLAAVGAALNLPQQKMTEGKALIRFFCQPAQPSLLNGMTSRNPPAAAPEKWEVFRTYNIRDVETELAIHDRLKHFPPPDFIWREYALDQEINDRGVRIDLELAKQAIALDDASREQLKVAMQRLTALENPGSVSQLRSWLADNGVVTETLGKKQVDALLSSASPEIREVLRLRKQLAKSSVKKYTAMRDAACADGRARGTFQFFGANRTGRFSGRLIQLQNLPQNHLPDLEAARMLVRSGDGEALSLLYNDVPDTLSQLIRTALIPSPGKKFIVSDFSAIEARVLAWLAGEEWRMEVFARGEDIYCASASAMFHVPVQKHGINGHLRQKGKIAELALGYGGAVGALKAMGALEMGIPEEELPELVQAWRGANPKIVRFWYAVEQAILETMTSKRAVELRLKPELSLTFQHHSGMLMIRLPSGRSMYYVRPGLGQNAFGSTCVTYYGLTAAKKWERLESYGPKFVENIVQGISRDILCHALMSLSDLDIVAHVHDEIILEAPPELTVEEVSGRMGKAPAWAPGLLLRADGYECAFYRKD